jgi:hypothetical protein
MPRTELFCMMKWRKIFEIIVFKVQKSNQEEGHLCLNLAKILTSFMQSEKRLFCVEKNEDLNFFLYCF